MKSTRPRHRRAWAICVAICAHLLALLALGWRIPKLAVSTDDQSAAAIEVILVRPPARPLSKAAPAGPARSAPRSSFRVLSAPVQGPPAPALAQGAADCAPEDLPLLTETERARCRNEIDADNERRRARAAEDRAARQVAEAERAPLSRHMDPDKRTYYDAVADAYWQQSHGPPMAGGRPGFSCSAGKAKGGPGTFSLGPCVFTPGQGFLTEETGVPRR
jgi:hypothetical protein